MHKYVKHFISCLYYSNAVIWTKELEYVVSILWKGYAKLAVVAFDQKIEI